MKNTDVTQPCKICQVTDHQTRDCPLQGLYRLCKSPDHIVKDCPNKKSAGRGRKFGKHCTICGGDGHTTGECPHERREKPEFCKHCAIKGHTRANCPQSKCTQCGKIGHLQHVCPDGPTCPVCGGLHTRKQCPKTAERERASRAVVVGGGDLDQVQDDKTPEVLRKCRAR